MFYLLVGLAMWWGTHLLKRVLPGMRRDMDKTIGIGPSKGIISVLILASVVLMFIGYRSADLTPLYTPFPGIGHLNNLLMLPAIYLLGVGPSGGRLSTRIRHPMLWGMFIWAVAHLLVNGDVASVVMFGGLGLWTLVQMRLINQHEGPWEVPLPGDPLMDYKLALTTLFLFVVIAALHWLFDHNPFLGTYG
ncbi:MAG: putative membrane protein [Paracoccaceae bacterium]|jgi:uncharacterized membrane protein